MILQAHKEVQKQAVWPPHNTVQTREGIGVGIGVGSTITHSCESEVTVDKLTLCYVAKGSGKVRKVSKEVSRDNVLRLHTVFRVLTQSEDLVSSLRSIYSGTCS